MDQNPIVGWLKIAAFAVLAYYIMQAVWQGTKLEDKLVKLEGTVSEGKERARENERLLNQIAANNQMLSDQLSVLLDGATIGGTVAAPSNGNSAQPTKTDATKTGKRTPIRRRRDEGTWASNDAIDADLDPSRPVGTPGRYKNFLKLDPAGDAAYVGPHDADATLNLAWGQDPKGFNFVLENFATLSDSCEIYVGASFASRHWKRPSSFNWAPELAWRVEVNEDYTEYTVFLRKDAYWHRPPLNLDDYPHLKGKQLFTAHDVEFTLDLIKDPQSNCGVTRAYLDKLVSWKALDDHTVVFKWSETQFTSLAYSMAPTILPKFIYGFDEAGDAYPTESVAVEFNNHWYDRLKVGPVGCGPYRFVKYEPGKYLDMERDDDWFGFKDQKRFAVKKLHYKIYTESETQMNWLRKGDIDIGGLNGTRYREWVSEETDLTSPFKNGDIETSLRPRTGYLYFAWKNTDPRFSDKRVRQALTYACNRKEICEKIFNRRYDPMASPIFPRSEEADPNLKPYPFDPEKSKQLLDEAGWMLNPATGIREKKIKGKVVELKFKEYWPGPNPEFQAALDHYKNDLQNIGVIMETQSVQWTQFQKQLRDREYAAFTLLWVVGGWEHDFGQIFHSKQIQDPTSSNYIEFSNPELDELQDRLRTLMDPEERIKVIHRIGNILYEEQPYTFFGWSKSYFGRWKHVKGTDKQYLIRPFFRTFPLAIDR